MTTSFLYQPPKPDRKIKSMVGKAPERRADRVAEHVGRGWLPVNPTVYRAVRELVQRSDLDKHRLELEEEIKKDPGTYFHYSRSLKSLGQDSAGIDPLDALASLEQEKLSHIFSAHDGEISTHRIWEATPAQTLRTQHAVISSRTAEALAVHAEISPHVAFSSAIIRQLGHSLVAWNYPQIYSRALLLQKTKGVSLEENLAKQLGVSTAQLGARFAVEWNLAPEIRRAASATPPHGSRSSTGISIKNEGDGLTVEEICQLSELFAEANDPDHYPNSSQLWASAEQSISRQLGVPFDRLVRPNIEIGLALISAQSHRKIETPFFHDTHTEIQLGARAAEKFAHNAPANRTEPAVRKQFEQVYARMSEAGVAVDALRYLVDQVIPSLGFDRGCLYLLQKDRFLRPMLRVGDLPLTSYKPCHETSSHPAAESLECTIPLRRYDKSVDGTERSQIFGSLDSDKYPGVLELHVKPERDADPNFRGLQYFSAIRAALLDCLLSE